MIGIIPFCDLWLKFNSVDCRIQIRFVFRKDESEMAAQQVHVSLGQLKGLPIVIIGIQEPTSSQFLMPGFPYYHARGLCPSSFFCVHCSRESIINHNSNNNNNNNDRVVYQGEREIDFPSEPKNTEQINL